MAARGARLHTMNPNVADIMKRMGMDETFRKLKQLDEAAALVEEGKLKKEVYDALASNVEMSLQQASSNQKFKKKEKNIFKELLGNLMPAREGLDNSASINTRGEKPILETWLYKRGKQSMLGGSWKKRWVALYPRAMLIFRNRGDRTPKETVILTPEFFVSKSTGQQGPGAPGSKNSGLDPEDVDGSESVATEEATGRGTKREMEHMFVLSDLDSKHLLATKTEEECTLWIHTITATLRKVIDDDDYFDTPRFIDGPVRRPDEIQADFERRKQAYLQSMRKKTLEKAKSNKSIFGGRKRMTEAELKAEEERWAAEGDEIAKIEMARKLLDQEREHVRRLEEEQRRREDELNKVRKFAEEWREKAESNRQKFEEADARAERAIEEEKKLEAQVALMQQMRAQNMEKEDAIKAEQETTEQQLENVKLKRRMSQHPLASAQYEQEIKALQAKLAALQSALQVDLDGLDWDGSLEDAENKMKLVVPRLMSEDTNEALDAQAEFDQWDKIIRNHVDYKKREENKWVEWEAREGPKNEEALAEMRRMVPREVLTGVSEAFLQKRGLSPAAAKRVMNTKILQFLYMDKETIAKVHIADLSSRYIPQGLDIVELRAIYTRLPAEFQNDRDGSKKNWLDTVRNKLKALTEKEANGQLTRPEERHPAYRSAADNKAAAAAAAAARPKKKGAKPAVAKKIDTSKLNALFAGGPGGPPGKGPGGKGPPGFPGAGGPPPHVLAMMKGAGGGGGDDDAGGAPAARPRRMSLGRRLSLRKSASKDGFDPAPAKARTSGSRRKSNALSFRAAGGSFFNTMRNFIGGGDTEETIAAQAAAVGTKHAGYDSSDDEGASPARGRAEPEPEEEAAGKKKGKRKVKGRKKKPEMTEEQKLLAAGVRGMMDSVKDNYAVELDDFDEKNAPAFDFGGDYSTGSRKQTLSKQRAGEFSKGIEDGIENLISVIKDIGKPDKAEGGVATVTFGRLFEEYEHISDMLVGLLMRAKKRKRIKYAGDMLFQGIHDSVKITVLH